MEKEGQKIQKAEAALSDEEVMIVSGGISRIERVRPSDPTHDPENKYLIRYEKNFTCCNKQCSKYGVIQIALASSDNDYRVPCSGCGLLY